MRNLSNNRKLGYDYIIYVTVYKTTAHSLARLEIYIVRGFHLSQSKHLTSQWTTLWRTTSKTPISKLFSIRLILHKLYTWTRWIIILAQNITDSLLNLMFYININLNLIKNIYSAYIVSVHCVRQVNWNWNFNLMFSTTSATS